MNGQVVFSLEWKSVTAQRCVMCICAQSTDIDNVEYATSICFYLGNTTLCPLLYIVTNKLTPVKQINISL